MSRLKELYRKNVYGVMGTLIFHILIVGIFLIAELNKKVGTEKEEAVLLDFTTQEHLTPEMEKQQEKNSTSYKSSNKIQQETSNQAVNDATINKTKEDRFFDNNYKRDIEEAKKIVADVNKQLSKKITQIKKYEMPEVTTEGQNPDSIKNIIYSGKSNIHYFLENRFHLRLPIPVYLAKNGGVIRIDIQVDRSGKVLKADANKFKGDQMLVEYALQAAIHTLFNADPKAPALQKGSITYKFVAQ